MGWPAAARYQGLPATWADPPRRAGKTCSPAELSQRKLFLTKLLHIQQRPMSIFDF